MNRTLSLVIDFTNVLVSTVDPVCHLSVASSVDQKAIVLATSKAKVSFTRVVKVKRVRKTG